MKEIDTKFGIGDSLWTIKNDRPYQFLVYDITVKIFNNNAVAYHEYTHTCDSPNNSFKECDCFKTKDLLAHSIIEN